MHPDHWNLEFLRPRRRQDPDTRTTRTENPWHFSTEVVILESVGDIQQQIRETQLAMDTFRQWWSGPSQPTIANPVYYIAGEVAPWIPMTHRPMSTVMGLQNPSRLGTGGLKRPREADSNR